MSATLEELKNQATELPREQRIALAEHLLEDPATESALLDEWNRRLEEMRTDPSCARPVDDFIAELRELYP